MRQTNRQILFNIPNLLTYGRIATIPGLVLLLHFQNLHQHPKINEWLAYSSAALFILAGISDLVDGYYARRHGMVSLLGKFIDPMADKLIHMTVLIMLIPLGRMPAWLVVLLLFREIFITGLRAVAAGEGLILDAGSAGKKKTAFLTVGLSGILIYYPIFGVDVYHTGWVLVIIGTIYAYYSGVEYFMRFIKKVLLSK